MNEKSIKYRITGAWHSAELANVLYEKRKRFFTVCRFCVSSDEMRRETTTIFCPFHDCSSPTEKLNVQSVETVVVACRRWQHENKNRILHFSLCSLQAAMCCSNMTHLDTWVGAATRDAIISPLSRWMWKINQIPAACALLHISLHQDRLRGDMTTRQNIIWWRNVLWKFEICGDDVARWLKELVDSVVRKINSREMRISGLERSFRWLWLFFGDWRRGTKITASRSEGGPKPKSTLDHTVEMKLINFLWLFFLPPCLILFALDMCAALLLLFWHVISFEVESQHWP